MPIPKVVAQLNRVAFNRLNRHVLLWVPGFGVIVHRGRRSGRTFRTPVWVFRTADGYLFALVYGQDTDWVKNVLAAGQCKLQERGRTVRLAEPRLYRDEERRGVRPVERQLLRLIDVDRFLTMTVR
ncbi:MAG: nitroreductase family deazaflavin-dependent oxidoreductase [Streptosporangiales bacterium]|nr:nitroreductase family deazaflavin-dependent oxidoreductase [Streptosporangiales bacterium]